MEIFETFYNSFAQLKNESGESTISGLFVSLSSSLSLGLMLFFVCSRYFASVKSKSIFVVSGLLPLCISGIIWAVASNFFLSLGLIGALSIVRYRTPVKNPLDLAYFLSLITVGIVSTISPIGAFVIAASLSLSVIALANFSTYKRYGNEFNQELVGKYIYFDTLSFNSFFDGEEGSVPRKKYRYRVYDTNLQSIEKGNATSGVFEKKETFSTGRSKLKWNSSFNDVSDLTAKA